MNRTRYRLRFSSNNIVKEINSYNYKRLRIILVSIFLLIFVLIGKLVYLQIFRYKYYYELAREMIEHLEQNQPLRGTIYDCNRSPLALSIVTLSCGLCSKTIPKSEVEKTAKTLSSCLNLKYNEVYHKITSTEKFIWIKQQLLPEECDELKKHNLPFLAKVKDHRRFYVNNDLAWHLVGRMGLNKPNSGIEYSANEILSGKPFKESKLRDRYGHAIGNYEPLKLTNNNKPRDLVLTIDKNIQYIINSELSDAMERYSAKQGIAIVQQPYTGDILAIDCRPGYSIGEGKKEAKYFNNPAVSHVFEPGSVFKAITLSALLEEKKVTPNDVVFCENGNWVIYKKPIRDHEKKGNLTVKQVIEVSSNIGTAKLAMKLTKEKLYEYICRFGFNVPTGISLPTISFGQEIATTAIQIVNAYSAIANGGNLLEPHVIKTVLDSDSKKVIKEYKPTIIRRAISKETAATVNNILISVVTHGTGIKAQVMGYRIAGKTGTAQKYEKETRKYSLTKHIALFCGYIPADKPLATILVVLDEPRGDYWGSSVACPVFAKISERLMEYWNIPPDMNLVKESQNKKYAKTW